MQLERLQGRAARQHGRKAKNAARWLDTFEYAYARRMHETGEIVRAMQHDGSNDGRGQVIARIGVNATTISASDRPRIRDSHDARDAESRATVRPYSTGSYLRDLERNYSPRIPPLTLADGTQADMSCYTIAPDGTRTLFEPPAKEERKPRTRAIPAAQARAARLRAIVGNADTVAMLES